LYGVAASVELPLSFDNARSVMAEVLDTDEHAELAGV